MSAAATWRRVAHAALRVTDPAIQACVGMHSNIPACCVLAFVLGRSEPGTVKGAGYRPCRRCAAAIRAGRKQPAVVENCNRAAPSCRFWDAVGRWRRSVHPDARRCPACERWGWEHLTTIFPFTELGRDGWTFEHCTWCGETRGRSDAGAVTLGIDASYAQLRALGLYMPGDPTLPPSMFD